MAVPPGFAVAGATCAVAIVLGTAVAGVGFWLVNVVTRLFSGGAVATAEFMVGVVGGV